MKLTISLLVIIFCSKISFSQDTNEIITLDSTVETLESPFKKLIGQDYKEFVIKTNDSTELSNKNLLGKVTFINFWFESCQPCVSELTGFNQMYEKLKDSSDFQFISFCRDSEQQIKENKKKFNINYDVIHLENEKCYELNYNSGFPTSIVIDRNGEIKLYSGGGPVEIEKATERVMKEYYSKIIEEL